MFGSTVIDLVIAIAAIFIVFSLATSGLRELVARLMATRAKELWRALRRLLDDPLASDMRELRAIATDLDATDADDGRSLGSLIDTAESALRSAAAVPHTAAAWRAHVKRALAPVRAAIPTAHGKVVTRTERRLWLRQPGGSRSLLGAVRAGRRGGDRPLLPAVATPMSVTALAGDVRKGTKTLTDAVNDHPLIRQIDGTWHGYLSRLKRLEGEDFSGAVLEIVRLAGLEPALSASFEPVLRHLDELYPDESTTELFWEPIAAGLADIIGKFETMTTTPGDISAVVSKIGAGIDEVIGDLGGISEEDHALLLEQIDTAQDSLVKLIEDPALLIRGGAEILPAAAPVTEALKRLTAGLPEAAGGARERMAELRGDLESWYDSRMDALSERYRRRTRLVSFALALVVVLAFNVDAVHIPLELWRNDQVRELVAAGAAETQGLIAACLEDGATADSPSVECVKSRVDQLVETGLPLGWKMGTTCDGACDSAWESFSYAVGAGGDRWGATVVKPAGWLLAAAAISLGATFWFDILRRAGGLKKAREAER